MFSLSTEQETSINEQKHSRCGLIHNHPQSSNSAFSPLAKTAIQDIRDRTTRTRQPLKVGTWLENDGMFHSPKVEPRINSTVTTTKPPMQANIAQKCSTARRTDIESSLTPCRKAKIPTPIITSIGKNKATITVTSRLNTFQRVPLGLNASRDRSSSIVE